jgi:hypothetical protein
MFYYLLYNSSFSFIVDNRLFSTILYGSILYILTHAILNYCKVEILEIINNYFWITLVLDIISLIYGVYQNMLLDAQNPSPTSSIVSGNNASSNMDVTFNLLKNKINTIGTYFNKNNEISIGDPVPKPKTPLRIQTQPPIPSSNQSNQPIGEYSNNVPQITNSGSLSTPLSSLGNSTPISMLRGVTNGTLDNSGSSPSRNTRVNNMSEPIIFDDDIGREESVAGSDVGSVIDLDDFEKTL